MREATNRRHYRVRLALLVILGLVVSIIPAMTIVESATAANSAEWNAGYIISDANFYDANGMTAAEVQTFLNGKVSTCRSTAVPCLKNYSQSTDNRPADRYCNGYAGRPSETAAQIIDNVARSCGIAQKVLLVLLEKEQSLVTSANPDKWSYSAATGQGCPDTAPCDPATSGFFYQVYYAARQYEIYRLTSTQWGYQAGRWNNILYSPTTSCGTRSVYIQNQATAALYIYTPYTPNQAALNNLYGTGDGCSTYGNRNFWRLYTDWFGNPTGYKVVGEYAKVWAALGSQSGLLGTPTGDEACNGRYCEQPFEGGTIYWFPGRGVFGVPSVIRGIWQNLGFIDGDAGLPTGVVVCTPDVTCTQSFDGGVIAADSNGGSLVGRHVESAWINAGRISLRAARGPEVCSDGVHCAQMFARGALFSGGTATAVTSPNFEVWNATGLTSGALGFPTADVSCTPPGCAQSFAGGLIVSAGGRTEAVPQPIASKYLELGGLAVIGGPQTAAICESNGMCNQRFVEARIDTSSRGVVVTRSWFLRAWGDTGYEAGRLGLPSSDMVCVPVTCFQSFEGGVLSGSPSGVVVPVYGAYRDRWMAAGGPTGAFGLPVKSEACNGHYCAVTFEAAVMVWTPRAGVVTVTGWFLPPWQAQGASAGRLGIPSSDMACVPVTCYQSFEGGVLTGSPSGAIVAVHGAYRDRWMATGGPSGALGLPIDGEKCNGAWCSISFERGLITWSPSTGTFEIVGPILSRWTAAGGAAGQFGLPIGTATATGSAISQQFQRGTLTAVP